jgi:hypothetical protein
MKQAIGKLAGCVLLVVASGSVLRSQEIQLGPSRPGTSKGHVVLMSNAIQTEAGKPVAVELLFHVDQGFHINSHTPKDGLLIPTALKLSSVDVKILGQEYQRGTPFKLQIPGGETLDVYQGDFRVVVQIVAPKGETSMVGLLRYQACDNAGCFPARTLPVMVAVTAR